MAPKSTTPAGWIGKSFARVIASKRMKQQQFRSVEHEPWVKQEVKHSLCAAIGTSCSQPLKQQISTQLYQLYRQRWQIELCFRGWKKSDNLKHLHKHCTSPTHLKVFMRAAMILLPLTLCLARLVQEHMKEITKPTSVGRKWWSG